jgi:hypothetical protein
VDHLHESIISNCFYFKLLYHSMISQQSEDFVEVLGAWAKVIGVSLDRDSEQIH